jgi:hypothetical protein
MYMYLYVNEYICIHKLMYLHICRLNKKHLEGEVRVQGGSRKKPPMSPKVRFYLYEYKYIYVYINLYVYIYIYIYIYIYVYMYTNTHTYMYVYIYECKYIYMYMPMSPKERFYYLFIMGLLHFFNEI